MKKAAVIVSGVIHPILMPLFCVFAAVQFDWFVSGLTGPDQAKMIFLIIALSTILFPGINILLLKWYGAVQSLEMPTKKERFAPFVSSIFFFTLGYYILRKGLIAESIFAILFGCLLCLVLLTLINFFWKISAHAAGIFGLLGTTTGLFSVHDFGNIPLLIGVVLLCGMVLTARLILKAHSPAQVYFGALVGFSTLYLTVSQGIFI